MVIIIVIIIKRCVLGLDEERKVEGIIIGYGIMK